MPDKEFNLLHEPWILVIKPDGVTEEIGLLDLFATAHHYRGLAGELPTQDIAVLRLLLAILHAVFARFDLNGEFAPIEKPEEALTRWKALWDRREFPEPLLRKYLTKYEDRFWLFMCNACYLSPAELVGNRIDSPLNFKGVPGHGGVD